MIAKRGDRASEWQLLFENPTHSLSEDVEHSAFTPVNQNNDQSKVEEMLSLSPVTKYVML